MTELPAGRHRTVMADDADTSLDRRRELLRKRIAESGVAEQKSAENPPIRLGERHRLSAGQRRMWFLQSMDAADTTLNICVAFALTGALDEERLRAALGAVVARHPGLRATYGMGNDGEPYQVFHDDVEIPWQTRDVADTPDRDQQIEALARGEFAKPFDLADDLPLRTTLIRAGAAEFVLVLVVHHICWDDDSWGVFFADLNAAYNGRHLTGKAPRFVAGGAPGPESTEADIEYWRNTLQPLPEPPELPGAAAVGPSRRADRRSRELPTGLWDRVEAFARGHAATPFMVLLAAFAVLARRYTSAADFLIAVPVTQRDAAAENAIGYFGNTLLLRTAPRPQDTFASFVDAVRQTCLGGFAHQSVGIDRVVREANPQRGSGRDGLDQLVRLGFSMRKSVNGFAFDGIAARQSDLGAVTAQLPLAPAVVLDPHGVRIEFEYQSDVLAAEIVDQMLDHYVRLLDNALREPARRLGCLDILGPGERAAVLAQSHGDLAAMPATTMLTLLESVAARAPGAVALVSDAVELTYADLHGRANRLARWLIGQGIGAEDVVGLQLTTSVEFVVAMLAALKSGAAYLPIDPAYPDDRIEHLVADSRPRTVIGHREFDAAESAAVSLSGAVITDAERLRPLRPGNLAYVIYTSGSTGRPKGVAVAHHAIAEHVAGFIAQWTMTAQDRLLQSSSVSFDASLLDIFVTLSLGAQLVVPEPDAFRDIGYVADLIKRRGVTVLHMVPSMLSSVLLHPDIGEFRSLRHVPVGGEALSGEVADKFAGCFDARLRNHYGPTEAVVCSTHMPVVGPQGAGVVPIGVPNRNVYAYVLDDELQPVPAGVIGELYLGGAQLARGYLGRPALTAQRFVADPFVPGSRLYRSGDLVRRNCSGELEFVGRADQQVKIRGFRVEPGEVESVIAAHPAVRQCVVVADDTGTGPTLAAYVVPGDTGAGAPSVPQPDLDDVRAHAAAVLPDYMVPGSFAVIDEIPLTVSGKLDRRALPAPSAVVGRGYREPTTPTQSRMCSIFARVLGHERVGADDSFFALGGHSLLAARLGAQIRAEFGVEFTVRVVFDTPTPAGLAARLVERFRADFGIDLDEMDAVETVGDRSCEPRQGRPQLVAAARPQRIPLSYSQLAMWFQYRMEGPSDVGNVALALRFDGPLDTAALADALRCVADRHEALRMIFAEHEGVPHQFRHPDTQVDLPVRKISADRLDDVIAELRRHVFSPESELLIRPVLLELGAHTHVLLVLMLHLVIDHASLGIVVDDLVGAYRARLAGMTPQWGTPAVGYADYVLWQRNAFDGADQWGQAELEYWCAALAGLPDEISVAHDRPRPAVLGKRGEVVNFTVPAARRAALAALAEQSGATEFMVYQAVLAVLLCKLGGGTDIAIGSPAACRVDAAAADLVGLFANMVVLRNDLSGDPSLRAVLAGSRDVVLEAFAHQELPIERLVEALNPPRSRSRNPLFQTMLNFRGEDWALIPRDVTGETTVVPLPIDLEVPFLDLNLGLYVTPDKALDVSVVANADLYDPSTARLIADALRSTLDAFALTPDCAVSALHVLPTADLRRLLAPPAPAAAPQPMPPPVPRGSADTEQALIALLEELLEITGVEAENNFFALGGDSIICIKWSARAAAQGLVLTPPMVFGHTTIGELAAAVDATADQPAEQAEPAPWQQSAPMSASGLSADALAELTASWESQC